MMKTARRTHIRWIEFKECNSNPNASPLFADNLTGLTRNARPIARA